MTEPHGKTRSTLVDLGDHIAPNKLFVLVIGDGLMASHALPETGRITIGRSHACDIEIDHPSISREHAALHLTPRLSIEDLGSANGTRVRDERLPPNRLVPLNVGEVIDLGATMLIVQRRTAPVRLRRIWNHAYFEARLDEECVRADQSGTTFAVLRVRASHTLPPHQIEHALFEDLRSIDVIGSYSPQQYEALVIEASESDASDAIDRMRALLGAHADAIEVGTAMFPADGRSSASLIAAAGAGIEPHTGAEDDAAGRVLGADGSAVVVGRSMTQIDKLVERIAAGDISVLILGETGVGKEVLSERIHRLSPRARAPFLRLNCAALSESLLESELFGHVKGSFTGATQAKPGLLETASGGTVFLDEIGELPMTVQVKLLRVLEDRKVMRVGGIKPTRIDVRFVAATNRDVETEVARGRFRQDLYFRLAGITLTIPPLRERVDEIAGLARLFLDQASGNLGRTEPLRLSRDALRLLEGYAWPGNIRELRNMIERAALLCVGDAITPEHLPVEKMQAPHGFRSVVEPTTMPETARSATSGPPPPVPPATTPTAPGPPPTAIPAADRAAALEREMWQLERDRIVAALEACAGNQTRAAERLSISRRTLLKRLDQYDIPRPRKGRRPR